jgi:hypothetical protein
LSAGNLHQAAVMREELSPELDTIHEGPDQALAMVLALMISAGQAGDAEQVLAKVRTRVPPEVMGKLEPSVRRLRGLDFNQRLALLEAALPVLVQAGMVPLQRLPPLLREVAMHDGAISFAELAILRAVDAYVQRRVNPKGSVVSPSPMRMQGPVEVFLSALVAASEAQGDAAEAAFRNGARHCNRYLLHAPKHLAAREWDGMALNTALGIFSNLPLPVRKHLFEGALAVVLTDEKVTQHELNLVRAVAAAFNLPMPPLTAS